MLAFECMRICQAIKPQAAAALSGDWVSLRNYKRCMIIVHIGQNNVATTAITVDKAKTAAGGSESAGITMNNWWSLADFTQDTDADLYTKGTAAASITSSAAGADASIYVIDVAAQELGTDYDFLQVVLGASNAANYVQATYILYNAAYPQALLPTAVA